MIIVSGDIFMKIKVRVERGALIILTLFIFALSSLSVVLATGWSAGSPFHETIYVDSIKGKDGANVLVSDHLAMNDNSDYVYYTGTLSPYSGSTISVINSDLVITGDLVATGNDWGSVTGEPYSYEASGDGGYAYCPTGSYMAGFRLNDIGWDDYEYWVRCRDI